MGRYKFNKKLSLWQRVPGYKLVYPVADPATGEILFEDGHLLTKDDARLLDEVGVAEVTIDVEGQPLRVMSNRMCDLSHYVDFDPLAECGIKERVRFDVLQELLGQYSGEELKDQIRLHKTDLVPKHIIVDDILTSINYMNGLARGISVKDDIDHLGQPPPALRGRAAAEPVPHRLLPDGAGDPGADDHPGSGRGHPPEPHQHPPCHRRHQGILRLQPPEPVHGSDQPPGGADPQAASVRPGPRRPLPRAGQHGGPGRPLQPLRPHVPHRDPEGPNIGLISYLATYARINEYGFIEAPYRAVDKKTFHVSDEITYMTADEEDNYIVGQAAEPVDENGCLINARITARHRDEIVEVDKERVDYIDVSPRMMVSIATAMIPFLPNDDANRALMGANMQRQAVPLLKPPTPPIVGTGMEHKICIDSEIAVLAEGDGVVTSVDARHITVKYDSGEIKDYKLTKFLRSNHGTCINQRPSCPWVSGSMAGARTRTARPSIPPSWRTAPATEQGEIALGQNILVGFMTWEGYNYEDAVLLNERLVREDLYTSIHIEEYEIDARDTSWARRRSRETFPTWARTP